MSILWSPTGPQLKPLRGLFWRAVSWSRMASSLQKVTTHLNMVAAQLVAITDVNQKVTVAMPAGQAQTGTVAVVLKQAVVSMVMTQIQQGTITVAEGQVVTALAMNVLQGGTIASSLPKVLSSINGAMLPSGNIADTLLLPTTSVTAFQQQSGAIADLVGTPATALNIAQLEQLAISSTLSQTATALVGTAINQVVMASTLSRAVTALAGIQTQTGIIADTLPPAATSLVGAQTDQGTIASVLYQVATAALGAQGLGVSIADTLPSPMSTVVNGFEVPGGFIADVLPLPSSALAGAQTQYGTVVDIIPQPTTAIQSAQTDTGTITSTLGMPSSAIVANQTQGGTIADQLAKISAALNAIEHPQLAIAAALQLASTAITAGQAQSGVVADVLLKAVTSLQSLQTQSGTIASNVIKALTAIAATLTASTQPVIKGTPTVSATTTVTIPSHVAGDLIIIITGRNSNTLATKPAASGTVPAWQVATASTGTNTVSEGLYWFIATANNHTSGTWTNATRLSAIVIQSGTFSADTPFGTITESSGASTASQVAPSATLFDSSGISLVLRAFVSSSAVTYNAPPTGYSAVIAGTGIGVDQQSDNTVANAETRTTSAASAYHSITFEILSPGGITGVTLDSVQSTSVATGTSATLATTASAGSYVLIDIVVDSNVNISSVTFGGTTITDNDTTTINNSATNGKVWRYYVPSATAANQSAVVITSASTDIIVGVTSYLGTIVDRSAQKISGQQTSGASPAPQTVTVPAGGRAVILWGGAQGVTFDQPGTAGVNRINAEQSNGKECLVVTDGIATGTYALATNAQTINWGSIATVLSPTTLPVNYKGSNSAASTSVSIPAHAIGDIIVMFAWANSAAVPTKPAASGTVPAWTTIDPASDANNGMISAYFVATATNHTSGTWANATEIAVAVLSHQSGTPIGGHSVNSGSFPGAGTNSPVAAAITMAQTDGTSQFLYFVGVNVYGGSAGFAAVTVYTQRTFQTGYQGVGLYTKDDTTSDGSFSANNTQTDWYYATAIEIVSH
jgi:hypothetical protein